MLMREQDNLSARQKDILSKIYIGSLKMADLIDLFSYIFSLEGDALKVKLKKIDIVKSFSEVIQALSPEIEKKKIKATLKRPKNKIFLFADEDLIKEIFKNLLSNAIKYSPQKSAIRVDVQKKSGAIIFSVKDFGCGIPQAEQKYIFKKIFRASNVQKLNIDGFGLDLYVVGLIIKKTGGKAWFSSTEKKGSIFYVSYKETGMIKQ